MSRYSRQIAVRSVGEKGHTLLQAANVQIDGEGLDSEICALYLAGAGIGRLSVPVALLSSVQAINSEIVVEGSNSRPEFCARLNGLVIKSDQNTSLARGSQVARDVLAALLSGRTK